MSANSTGVPGSLVSGPFGTGTITFNGPGTRSTTGTDTTVGNAIIFAADATFPSIASEKTLTLTGPVTLSSNRTLMVNVGATVAGKSLTITNVISDGGNNYSLTKAGTGRLVLSGPNTYGGDTKVSGGTLLVNNTTGSGTGSGAVTVNGGTLGGTGIISGVVTNDGGTLSPGASIGTLTISSALVLNGGATTTFEVNGSTPTNDVIVLGAAVTYGGVLNIVTNGTFTAGQTFTLFSGAGGTNASNFASLAGSPGAGLAFTFTNGVLSVLSTGPSGPAMLTNSVSGGVLSLAWPAGQGWRLQSQINALTSGLGTNWVEAANSSVSSTNITIDPTKPTVFYRLVYP